MPLIREKTSINCNGCLAPSFHTLLQIIQQLLRHSSERWTNLFNLAWVKSRPSPLSQVSAAVFTSPFEENLVQEKYLEPGLGAKSGLYGRVASDFPLELSQQFLNFASSMEPGIDMQKDDAITQHARAFASNGFTMAQRALFPFSEIEEILIWNKVLFKQ
ncbi:hypothetical protein AVEN_59860-1 [Araneus ventricosus]|uniref:Uncharacterized protein n=1 Tax=Araneus ventricosus TaxID=182803 RepID=A0A4Y2FHS8_ARAVE|nr:hypothetical protein AVEN_59860-1 [Araneus ventricosus]